VNNAEVINLAQTANIQLVRFLYCDHSGVTRAKAIHVSHLANKLREGIGLTRAQMAMNLLEQLIDIDGMEPVGEIRLVPDPETFSILPWTPGSASLICDQLDHNHMNWGSCPRCFLKDMVARAERMGNQGRGYLRERVLPGTRARWLPNPFRSSASLQLDWIGSFCSGYARDCKGPERTESNCGTGN